MKTPREIIDMLLECVDELMTDAEVDAELEDAGVDVPDFLAKVRARVQKQMAN
jgi:hypothetical protein